MSAEPKLEVEGREYVRLLEVDPVLKEAVPREDLEVAGKRLLARCATADPGPWDETQFHDPGSLGLLVVEGLLTRDVEISGTPSRELLGPGDILRPWDDDTVLSPLPTRVSWTILEPARLGVLDRRFALLAGRWPDMGAEILHRVLRRSRWLAILLAITNVRGVEERVVLLLWHMAASWGRVTPEGTLVPFCLTHEVIAQLVGARRPSVTKALSGLQAREDLERVDEGWLLRTDPPASPG